MSSEKKIFEHVNKSGGSRDSGSKARRSHAKRGDRDRRLIAWWLLVQALLIVGTILIGGATRITDSGLSITEWEVFTGTVPPLNAEDWAVEFEKYKQTPEFILQNVGMTMAEFKTIYWWEWSHRTIAKVLGLVWMIGFAWLAVRGSLNRNWTVRSLQIGGLIIFQGALAWWMVSSGLTGQNVDVAAYRLAIHLTLAFAILGFVTWSFWQIRSQPVELYQAVRRRNVTISRYSAVLVVVLLLQVFLGGLVAGLDAGTGYTDWPLMNGQFLPDESFAYDPVWINFFENIALTQFNHRIVGYILLGIAILFWLRCRRTSMKSVSSWSALVVIVIICQALAGIATLFHQVSGETAILHQAGAIAVLLFVMRLRFLTEFPPDDRIGRA